MAVVVPTALREHNSVEVVARRFAGGDDLALGRVVATVVRHLHEAVREVRPSMADWRAAIGFLTEVGHAADERRQEWVLLSDLLGVTQLVEEINGVRPKGATPNTARGPFYRPDAPRLAHGADICLDGAGETLVVTGHVRDLDGAPVADATVETWQANGEGLYENQQPDLQPEFNLRGRFRTDAEGHFTYRTVRPAGYAVPDDGPAGQLLLRLGQPLRRPAHLSFLISAHGFETLTTQVYDGADPHLDRDPLYGVKPELVAELHCVPSARPPVWSVDFTFVLARSRRPVR